MYGHDVFGIPTVLKVVKVVASSVKIYCLFIVSQFLKNHTYFKSKCEKWTIEERPNSAWILWGCAAWCQLFKKWFNSQKCIDVAVHESKGSSEWIKITVMKDVLQKCMLMPVLSWLLSYGLWQWPLSWHHPLLFASCISAAIIAFNNYVKERSWTFADRQTTFPS